MSWSDDMRCLHCDGKLPLYRKITHGQFCSTAHRKAYWQEQERLAVERLHQTHNSLRAFRPAVPIEAILGPIESSPLEHNLVEQQPAEPSVLAEAVLPHAVLTQVSTPDSSPADPSPAEMSGFVQTLPIPLLSPSPRMIVTDAQVYEMEQAPGLPVWSLPAAGARGLQIAEALRLTWTRPNPRALGRSNMPLSLAEGLTVREVPIPVCRPMGRFPLSSVRMSVADAVEMPFTAQAVPASPALPAGAAEHLGARIAAPPIDIGSWALQPAAPDWNQLQEAGEQIPEMAGAIPLARFACANIPISAMSSPEPTAARPTQATLPDQGSPSIVPAQPRMGKGSRYPIQFRASSVRRMEPEPADLAILPPEIALPDREVEVALQASEQAREAFIPEPCFMLIPLLFGPERLASMPAPPRVMVVSTIPQPLRSNPVLPVSKLEPLNPPPVYAAPEMPAPFLADSINQFAQNRPEHKNVFAHAVGFWKHAPRDLKILLFSIPALLVLAFHPPLPKVHVAVTPARSTGQITQTLHSVVAGQWANVRQAVFDRAAVALDEDFRTGLDDWTSRANATAEWSFDATGFVRPGPLALYRPSMNLRDYQMQFLGMIDKKSLSWVVRAVDYDNYYVVKMVVLKPGPLTSLGITRYAVINGQAENRVDSIVPVDARPDMLYRVKMDIHDDTFALYVQEQMTDTWSEPRLPKGGIGFFNARGEESRVRWVQVTHQYDMLGRLCAYLAPYDIPTTNGSW